jgi:hypothetical protein
MTVNLHAPHSFYTTVATAGDGNSFVSTYMTLLRQVSRRICKQPSYLSYQTVSQLPLYIMLARTFLISLRMGKNDAVKPKNSSYVVSRGDGANLKFIQSLSIHILQLCLQNNQVSFPFHDITNCKNLFNQHYQAHCTSSNPLTPCLTSTAIVHTTTVLEIHP